MPSSSAAAERLYSGVEVLAVGVHRRGVDLLDLPAAGGFLEQLLGDQPLQVVAVELVPVVEPLGLRDRVCPVDGAAEPETLFGPLPGRRGAVGEVAPGGDEAVSSPAGRRRLRLLLKVQRQVAHEAARVGDRADVLAAGFGIDLTGPYAGDHLSYLL